MRVMPGDGAAPMDMILQNSTLKAEKLSFLTKSPTKIIGQCPLRKLPKLV